MKETNNLPHNHTSQQTNVSGCAIIDIEFTGLDNSFITDNEIIQVKMINVGNKKNIIRNFNSNKQLSAYAQLEHKVIRYEDCPIFSIDEFTKMLSEIDLSIDAEFWGFGVEQDIKMLAKYGCNLSIRDIRTHYQKTKFAYRMATEGSGLESTYLIVTGEYPPTASHADFTMSVVPFGHCAGMNISDYVQKYRRQADGYRYSNSDAFAFALNNAINEIEYIEDDFDDDDDYF